MNALNGRTPKVLCPTSSMDDAKRGEQLVD
jgi:hypothetical protein